MNNVGEQFWIDATARITAQPAELCPAMIEKLSGGNLAMASSLRACVQTEKYVCCGVSEREAGENA